MKHFTPCLYLIFSSFAFPIICFAETPQSIPMQHSTIIDTATTFQLVARDLDGEQLRYSLAQASNGSLEISESGEVTYTPRAGFIGTDSFSFTATKLTDEQSVSDPQVVAIKVFPGYLDSAIKLAENINGKNIKESFGYTTSISGDGRTLVAGGIEVGSDDERSGVARVYTWDTSAQGWVQLGSDIIGDSVGDSFGSSASISADGKVIAIGSPSNDSSSNDGYVKTYQWDVDNDDWVQLGATLSSRAMGDKFGTAISLSADGEFVAIGATESRNGTDNGSGYVQVYRWNTDNTIWQKVGSDINGNSINDFFGTSVSISANGHIVAIGASQGYVAESRNGHVQVHQLVVNSGVETWSLLGNIISGESENDNAGGSVSLSADGRTVAVGATANSNSNGDYSGHVRIYKLDNSDTSNFIWSQLGDDIDGMAANDSFGNTISLSANGRTIAASAPYRNANGDLSGQVSIYMLDDTDTNFLSWSALGEKINGESAFDTSGLGLSLSADGLSVAIGSPYHDNTEDENAGQVRVFRLDNTAPVASAVQVNVTEDTPTEITLVAVDADGHELSFSPASIDAAIGTLVLKEGTRNVYTFTPAPNYAENFTFTYKVNDGQQDSQPAIVTVSLLAVDDPPDIGITYPQSTELNEDGTSTITLPVKDVDGDDLNYEIATQPQNGTVSIVDNKVIYTPNANYSGQDTFTYIPSDSQDNKGAAITLSITVVAVNDVPLASDMQVVTPKNNAIDITLVANDPDEGDELTFNVVDAPKNGALSMDGQVVNYQPNTDYVGLDSFTYTVKDSSDAISTVRTVSLSIFKVYPERTQLVHNDKFVGNEIAVSLSDNGDVLAVGVPYHSVNDDLPQAGFVQVFKLQNNLWKPLGTRLVGWISKGFFGRSVSISGDGKVLAIGHPGYKEKQLSVRSDNGSVSTFIIENDSLRPMGEPLIGELTAMLGSAVSLSRDGKNMAVWQAGPIYRDISVYAFKQDSWQKVGSKISTRRISVDDPFSLSMSADGNTLAVGHLQPYGRNATTISVYGLIDNVWYYKGRNLPVTDADIEAPILSVSLNADGTYLAVGERSNRSPINGISVGEVNVYHFKENEWYKIGESLFGELSGDYFGTSVSISDDGKTLAVGATDKDRNLSAHRGDNWRGYVQLFYLYQNDWLKVGGKKYGDTSESGFGFALSLDASGNTLVASSTEGVSVFNVPNVLWANPVSFLVVENTPTELTLMGASKNNIGTELNYSPESLDLNVGSLSLKTGSKNTFVFTPAVNNTKDFTFTYTVNNGEKISEPATITIKILKDTDGDGDPDTCDDDCSALGNKADTDDDNDGILDLRDAYPLIAIGELNDTDGDGAPNDCDDTCIASGMAADNDDDNDGLTDAQELANNLNPLDAADAKQDRDSDGASNIDEILAGTDIDIDDQAPTFMWTLSDIVVVASGSTTQVELVNPRASDNGRPATVSNDSNGQFAVGEHIVTYTATDEAGNTATVQQNIRVLPYLYLTRGKILNDGQVITLSATLSDEAIKYPVTANIKVSGSASKDDYTLSTSDIKIEKGLTQIFELKAIDDGFGEENETVELALVDIVNAGIKPSSRNSEIFTITEENIPPVLEVSVVQDGVIARTVDQQTVVNIGVQLSDVNGTDTLKVEYSGIENLVRDDKSFDISFDPSEMAIGIHKLTIKVTDIGQAQTHIVTQNIVIKLIDNMPELTSVDTDGDGIADNEEGYGDSDNDGIPDYQDITDQINLQPIGDGFAQADDGVLLALGSAALEGDRNSITVDADTLVQDTEFDYSEIFDFTLSGLDVGASYNLVLPLSEKIPADAVYRKLTGNTWVDFVEDANNTIHSASTIGSCPSASYTEWEAGLIEGGTCIKLRIEDGSANDTDGAANGTVEDPSGIAVVKKSPPPVPSPLPAPNVPTNTGGSGGGAVTIYISLSLLFTVFFRRKYMC